MKLIRSVKNIMGRRAKNKQGDPQSLREPNEHISKKLGKRKADPSSDQKRPAKKVKDPARLVTRSEKAKLRPAEKEEWRDDSEEPWGGIEEDRHSEGWDDVQDEGTVPVHSRCVFACSSRSISHGL